VVVAQDQIVAVSIGGGRKIVLDDVCNVAVNFYPIALDLTSLEKADEDARKYSSASEVMVLPHSSVAQAVPSDAGALGASESVCRAALLVKLITIMQGRFGIRSTVIELICAILNAKLAPVLSTESNAGFELVHIISGLGGFCYSPKGKLPVAEAFAEYGLEATALTQLEIATLVNSQFFSTGKASIFVSGVFNVASVIDVIASLTCEALSANVDAFDAVTFDIFRQHRGQMASSANLRQLLEGSKRCASAAGSSSAAIKHIPQINGPVQEALLVQRK